MEQPIVSIPKIIPPNLPDFLSFLNFSFLFRVPVLICILFAFLFFYFIVSCVLFYHWTKYGMGSAGIFVAEILFLSVSVFLFITAFMTINYF